MPALQRHRMANTLGLDDTADRHGDATVYAERTSALWMYSNNRQRGEAMTKRREWWIDPDDWRTDHGCQRVACFTKQEPDTVHVQEVPPGDYTNEEYHQRFLEDCGKIEALESRVAELTAAVRAIVKAYRDEAGLTKELMDAIEALESKDVD